MLMACLLMAALGGAPVAHAKNFSAAKAPLSRGKCGMGRGTRDAYYKCVEGKTFGKTKKK